MKRNFNFLFIFTLVVMTLFAAGDLYAKRSGFSSRSFSKPSPSIKFKSNRESTTVVNRANTQVSQRQTTTGKQQTTTQRQQVSKQQPTRNTQTFGATVQGKQTVAASRDSFKQQQAAFKSRSNTTTTTGNSTSRTTTATNYSATSSPVLNRTHGYDSRTYYERRSRYYDDWSTPTYAYRSYSSFGVWDSIALWYMLDHISDARYQSMYYHQMNSPGMQQWRQEANVLAKENADLRAKLNQLDGSVNTMSAKGVTRDPSFLPDGIDADIFLSEEARVQTRPTLTLCTGPTDKNYHNIGTLLARTTENVNIKLLPTNGSAENLENIDSGKCDAALTQRDAYLFHMNETNGATELAYNRLFSPYNEVIHLVCHISSGVEDLTDLNDDNTVIIGSKGSGSYITWHNLVAENDDYEDVKTLEIDGATAKAKYTSKEADCIMSVSGLNTQFMKTLIAANPNSELVEWNDPALKNAIDPAKEKAYVSFTLPASVYPTIQIDNKIGFFNVDTEVALVPADFIVANRWQEQNKVGFENFVNEVVAQLPSIKKLVGSN